MGGGWNNGQWEPHWFTPKPVVISTTPWRTLDHEYCAANRYRLLPQNDNPFDENALKVMCTRRERGGVPGRLVPQVRHEARAFSDKRVGVLLGPCRPSTGEGTGPARGS